MCQEPLVRAAAQHQWHDRRIIIIARAVVLDYTKIHPLVVL
ncbi:MAG TPA: hypothetical protein VJJ82_00955 [Candidatus Nanoarchaeia archaeon]|nr:hypothetical protein [Candidatus Nanoarchaeia archaeon]